MALSYVGGNVATKAGATSGNSTISLTALTGGIASSAAAGDLVIAVYATGSTADRALSITDGTTSYTVISSELYSNGTSYDTNLEVAYKRLTAADASVSFGPTGNAADAGAMAVHVWRGVNASTILDVAAVPATGTGTGRPNPPAILPVTAGSVIICAGGAAAITGAVFTASGLSNFRSTSAADTNDAMVGIGSFAWTSGSYDPAQWTGGTTAAADSWAAITFALRPAPDPSGSMSATETGSDTFTSSGDVIVKGGLSANETGLDSFTSTGKLIVKGVLGGVETGQDLFDSQGSVTGAIVGDLHGFEVGSDSMTSNGKVYVSGSMSGAEQIDTFAATGKVQVKGSLAATETGADTFGATGKVLIRATLDVHEVGQDSVSSSGKVVVTGTAESAETGQDLFDSQGSITGAIVGDLHVTEIGADQLVSLGKIYVQGELTSTEALPDSFYSTGKINVQGLLATAETGQDAFDCQGTISFDVIIGDLHVTEQGNDQLSSTGKVLVSGQVQTAETGNDISDITGIVVAPAITGSLASTEVGVDVFSSNGKVLVSGTFDASEFDDEFFAEGFTSRLGSMAAVEVGEDVFYAYQTPAANIWDTSQGVAKGYAKFTPMQDGEPFLQELTLTVSHAVVIPETEAFAAPAECKVNVSHCVPFGFSCSGAAKISVRETAVMHAKVAPSADSTGIVPSLSCSSGTYAIKPTAAASPFITYQPDMTAASGYTLPWGVKNPSDEEIIAVILEARRRRVLTTRKTNGITRA